MPDPLDADRLDTCEHGWTWGQCCPKPWPPCCEPSWWCERCGEEIEDCTCGTRQRPVKS